MERTFRLLCLLGACWAWTAAPASAKDVIWTCSRAESDQTVFDAARAYRIENLSQKDDYGIAITLMDLYGAYAGQPIQMGKKELNVCSLPVSDPLQKNALDMLGYQPEELRKALDKPGSRLVTVPTIHEMVKCITENHPAVGFFAEVVENESMSPCF